ncbi:MAG: methyltransferase domain-containing protein [Thermoplasmata archaeon]
MLKHLTSSSNENKCGFIFELSGEHESLPKAEIIGCLEAEKIDFRVAEEDLGVLIMDVPELDLEEMKRRLALTHNIQNHLFSCEADELAALRKAFEIGEGSFAVRAKRIQRFHENLNLKDVERTVAENVVGKNEVDLSDPNIEVRVILSDRCHIGITLAKIDRSAFESRKVQFRPYFSPVSLHPRLARALVNLSRVKKGQTLLDPFCGTGGVLIEAALVGAKPIGSDIDKRMVDGCQENLSSLNIQNAELFCSDIREVINKMEDVDAIATDPPYGRSATTNGEEVFSLYKRAFKTFSEVLKPGGYLSILLPDAKFIQIGEKYLSLKESYALRVHKSLTRNFCVYRKK